MIERIVVPVDVGTTDVEEQTETARAVAATLARRAGATVELVSVAEPFERLDVEPRLAELSATVDAPSSWRVVESGGPTEAALLTELHADPAALWCVPSHARGAIAESVLGSLSESLARDAHVPVLLVGPAVARERDGSVVAVALDGTDDSEVAIPAAARVATALGMATSLLQVVEPHPRTMPVDSAETNYLARMARRIPGVDPASVDFDVLHGDDAADDLAVYVENHEDIAMVAVATHGRRGLDRLLHGSTAFELAHRSKAPVLVLHRV